MLPFWRWSTSQPLDHQSDAHPSEPQRPAEKGSTLKGETILKELSPMKCIHSLQVNGYFQGKQISFLFFFFFLSHQKGIYSKRKDFAPPPPHPPHWEQILSFYSRSLFKRDLICNLRKSVGSHKSSLPWQKWKKPYHIYKFPLITVSNNSTSSNILSDSMKTNTYPYSSIKASTFSGQE